MRGSLRQDDPVGECSRAIADVVDHTEDNIFTAEQVGEDGQRHKVRLRCEVRGGVQGSRATARDEQKSSHFRPWKGFQGANFTEKEGRLRLHRHTA